MKKYKIFGAVLMLLLAACKTNADDFPTWKEDGVISNADGKQVQIDMRGIYDALQYAGFTYLAGFKIDKDGTNYPQIAKASNDLSQLHYWGFEKIPNDIFVYQSKIHFVTTDGEVYRLEKDQWQLMQLAFPPDSHIVYSDNNANIIVCYPAALEKAVVRTSGCKSLKNNWQRDFVWHTQTPKVCNGKLFVIDQGQGSAVLKKIDLTTGNELVSKHLKQIPEDLCRL